MSIFTNIEFWALVVLITIGIAYWMWSGRGSASKSYKAFNVDQWQPRTVRPLTKVELVAMTHIQVAAPECIVLPQVSVSRFVKVKQTMSYAQWFGRVGRRCVDFLLCSPDGDVLGAIDVVKPKLPGKENISVGEQRKIDTLQLATIPLWRLTAEQLADSIKLRQIILPELEAAEHALRTRGFAHTELQPRGNGVEAVELDESRWNADWPNDDSRPSELLDEFDSGSAPLPTNTYGR